LLTLKLKDNCKVNIYYGDKRWYQNGKLHRLDGPAIENTDGNKYWYQNGKCHRDNGPAIEYADGTKRWYKNGESQVPSPER